MRKKCLYVRRIQYLLILEDKRFTLQMAISISWAVSETKKRIKEVKQHYDISLLPDHENTETSTFSLSYHDKMCPLPKYLITNCSTTNLLSSGLSQKGGNGSLDKSHYSCIISLCRLEVYFVLLLSCLFLGTSHFLAWFGVNEGLGHHCFLYFVISPGSLFWKVFAIWTHPVHNPYLYIEAPRSGLIIFTQKVLILHELISSISFISKVIFSTPFIQYLSQCGIHPNLTYFNIKDKLYYTRIDVN